jgi:hypothetical protein
MSFPKVRSADWVIVCLFAFVVPIAAAQENVHFTRSEVRRIVREAKTPDQYKMLAGWFRTEETVFRSKANTENGEYLRYKNRFTAAKYPTYADTTRNLRDYYLYRANKSASLASRYEIQLSKVDPNYRPGRSPESMSTGMQSKNSSPSVSEDE